MINDLITSVLSMKGEYKIRYGECPKFVLMDGSQARQVIRDTGTFRRPGVGFTFMDLEVVVVPGPLRVVGRAEVEAVLQRDTPPTLAETIMRIPGADVEYASSPVFHAAVESVRQAETFKTFAFEEMARCLVILSRRSRRLADELLQAVAFPR